MTFPSDKVLLVLHNSSESIKINQFINDLIHDMNEIDLSFRRGIVGASLHLFPFSCSASVRQQAMNQRLAVEVLSSLDGQKSFTPLQTLARHGQRPKG